MAAKKQAPSETIVVPSNESDPGALARLVRAAAPGTRFVIEEGVYGPLVVEHDMSIAARDGADAQAVHIVGKQGEPAISIRRGTLTLAGVMVSAPEDDGVHVEAGSLSASACLFHTPEGAPLLLARDTRALLHDCFVGGGAVRVEGGALTLESSRFGQTNGAYGLDVSAGTLEVREGVFQASTPLLQGAETRASFVDCTFEAGIGNGLEARAGARVELSACRFLAGFIGLLVDGAEVRGRDLVFADARGRFPQLRAAIRLVNGAATSLADTTIRGAASVVAGMTPDGLLEARPWFDEPAQTDAFSKVAIAVTGGSRLVGDGVKILQRDFGALLVTDTGEARFVGGEIHASGAPLVLEGTATCALQKTKLVGTAPPLVSAGARLSLVGTKATRKRAASAKAVAPRRPPSREHLIVDASGGGDARTLDEALAFDDVVPLIVLRAGRYRESISLRQALTIVAEGEVVWEAPRDEPCLTVREGRVEIRGVRFLGKGSVEDALVVAGGTLVLAGCRVEGGRCSLRLDEGHTEAENCTFERSKLAGLLTEDGTLTLTGCTIASIENKPGHGLQATEGAHVRLVGCTFRDLAGHAIYATQGGPTVEAADIRFEGIGRSAICALGAAKVIAERLVLGETGEESLRVGEQGAISVDGVIIEPNASSLGPG